MQLSPSTAYLINCMLINMTNLLYKIVMSVKNEQVPTIIKVLPYYT